MNRDTLAAFYRDTLLEDVVPFWLRHAPDVEHGGIFTCLDREGRCIDTDKSIWFQGRAAWMFATLYNTVEPRPEWLDLARNCIAFLRRYGAAPDGKLYFTVTRDGRPLRMRRYVYSESFAAIANAALARATGDPQAAADALRFFARYLHHSFTTGVMPPKTDPVTRPMQGLGPHMIGIVTAQELRENLADPVVAGKTCTQWIDHGIAAIQRDFLKPDLEVVLETVGPHGEVIDHTEGRLLNPGHALEAAWFILREARHRANPGLLQTGLNLLDWMWRRGWDAEHGGLFYYRDLDDHPSAEYWHDMKFWWPHNEAVLATLLAYRLTGEPRYAQWHQTVHDWSFSHFPDPRYGEWYGYLHRDGTVSSTLKGTIWKGPFHLPRMLWYAWRLCAEPEAQPVLPRPATHDKP
ncbi:MAG TPA: AGE family epimerase/isomerase [Verrucomicrobiota bacterium]|nr:AGE family epimerase/isomerase [Verrucomicrobiota bacterium]HNU52795.1 AGE family epimerase/isomerase [Verrucomicrobiota bacterium]